MVSLTWKVPPKAASGATSASRRRGSRRSSMLTLTWAPSGALDPPAERSAARASRASSTAGPTAAQHEATARAWLLDRRSSTSPSGLIAVTSAPVRRSAPASRAARSSSAVTWPMPPDRHVPVAGPAADHVVQEAAVLAQALVVGSARRCR